MNLKIFNFETVLNLRDNIVNVVEIEDIKLFRKILETIQQQIKNQDVEEKVYIYDDDFKEISYRKVELIMNYINLFSNIKVVNELNKVLDNDIDEEKEEVIRTINLQLHEFSTKILYDLEVDLGYKESFNLKDLLRIMKININDNGSILDNLFSLIDFLSLMEVEQYLFFINLKTYLDNEEISEFYKYVIANNMTVVLLEGRASSKILKYEQKLYIDSTFDDHYQLHD